MKKRIWSLLLVLCLLATLLPTAALAAGDDIDSGSFHGFNWRISADGTLFLSGNGEMPGLDYNESLPWQRHTRKITAIEIGDGITGVKHGLVDMDMPNLTHVTLGASFAGLDNWTFGIRGTESRALANIDVSPDNNNYCSIDGIVYSKDATKLILVPKGHEFPNGVYTFPESVNEIGDYAFFSARNLKSVTIPDTITKPEYGWEEGTPTLPRKAFQDCVNLEYIDIGNSIKWIDESEAVFNGCNALRTIKIGDSFAGSNKWSEGGGFRNGAFISTGTGQKLEAYIVSENNPNFKSVDGVVYSKDGKELLACPGAKQGTLVIADGTEAINSSACVYCSGLTSVVFPEGLKTIGSSAFRACSALREINLPDTVTSVGDYAFRQCTNLEKAHLSENMDRIGDYQFEDCSNLSEVNIPQHITEIGAWAFHNCYKLSGDLIIPDTCTKIDTAAFTSCEGITSVKLPKDLKELSANLFSGCIALETLELPEGLEAICADALIDCKSLKEITLPASLQYVSRQSGFSWGQGTVYSDGGAPFVGCTSLEKITVAPGNEKFAVVDGMLYGLDPDTKKPTKLIECPAGWKGDAIIAVDAVEIGPDAFLGCTEITGVSIPDNLYSIDVTAFDNCEHLRWFEVGDNNVSYSASEGVLYNKDRTQLIRYPSDREESSFTVPNTVTRFSHGAFAGTMNLTNLTFGNGSETIQHNVLDGCLSVVNVVIPSGVTSIGPGAFMDCTALETVSLPNTITNIGENYEDGVFEGCVSLRQVNIPEGVSYINSSTFRDCRSLEEIKIPSTVQKIDVAAFYGCSSLRSFTFPEGYTGTKLPGDIFNGCVSLEYLVLPESITELEYDSLNGCLSLEKLYVPASMTSVNRSALINCDKLMDIYYAGSESDWEKINFQDETKIPTFQTWTVHFNHTHDTNETRVEPTCEADGYILAGCECGYGHISGEPIPAHGHDWGEWETVKAATCTENGELQRVCSFDASHVDTRTVTATGHDWGEWETVKAATATEDGMEQRVCRNDPNHVETRLIPATGEPTPSFKDVPADAYYADAVAWAVGKSITNGTSADTFSPNDNCTRAQVVTFLWRAAGEPEPTRTDNPFTDVQEGAYYYKAVLWAVENNITNGMSADRFEPDGKCTRGQVVTFQHRAAGEPEVTAANPFSDVKDGDYFFNAVLWAVSKRITNGTTAMTFSPNDICTRAQVVTFLYRGANG